MDDLIAFLLDRLDEAEAVAKAASPGPWRVNSTSYPESIYSAEDDDVVSGGRWGGEASIFDQDKDAFFIAYQHPARVLADVAAKRQIIKLHQPCVDEPECHVCGPHGSSGACLTLCLLALPDAGHPDYREEWRA